MAAVGCHSTVIPEHLSDVTHAWNYNYSTRCSHPHIRKIIHEHLSLDDVKEVAENLLRISEKYS